MKKLLFFAALFILSIKGYCQANSLTINNNTNCEVYYVLYGDKPGLCNQSYRSQLLSIPPRSSIIYSNPAAVPGGLSDGLTPPHTLINTDFFTKFRAYSSNPLSPCGSLVQQVEVGACSGLATLGVLTFFDPNTCTQCGTHPRTVDWLIATPTPMSAVVNIN